MRACTCALRPVCSFPGPFTKQQSVVGDASEQDKTHLQSPRWRGEPRNDCSLLHPALHCRLSLHLLYKGEREGERRSTEMCSTKVSRLRTPLQKNRAREMIRKFHSWIRAHPFQETPP